MRLIFLFLIQCIPSLAAPVDANQLKKALAKYQAMASLEVHFHQIKTLKDIQLKLESDGVLKVQLPNRVEWKVQKPQRLDMILEQDKVTLKSEGKEETFRASEGSAKDRRAFTDLLNWLRLDADALVKDYEVSETGPRTYRFSAKNSGTGMKALTMKIGAAGAVETLTFDEASGDEIHIVFGAPKVKYR